MRFSGVSHGDARSDFAPILGVRNLLKSSKIVSNSDRPDQLRIGLYPKCRFKQFLCFVRKSLLSCAGAESWHAIVQWAELVSYNCTLPT